LLAAPAARGQFRRAILQSGAACFDVPVHAATAIGNAVLRRLAVRHDDDALTAISSARHRPAHRHHARQDELVRSRLQRDSDAPGNGDQRSRPLVQAELSARGVRFAPNRIEAMASDTWGACASTPDSPSARASRTAASSSKRRAATGGRWPSSSSIRRLRQWSDVEIRVSAGCGSGLT